MAGSGTQLKHDPVVATVRESAACKSSTTAGYDSHAETVTMCEIQNQDGSAVEQVKRIDLPQRENANRCPTCVEREPEHRGASAQPGRLSPPIASPRVQKHEPSPRTEHLGHQGFPTWTDQRPQGAQCTGGGEVSNHGDRESHGITINIC